MQIQFSMYNTGTKMQILQAKLFTMKESISPIPSQTPISRSYL